MAPRQYEQDVIECRIRKDNVMTAAVAILIGALLTLLAFRTSPWPELNWSIMSTSIGSADDLMKLEDSTDNITADGNSSLLTPPTKDDIPVSPIWQAKLDGELVCNGGPMDMADGGADIKTAPGYTITTQNWEHILACVSNSKKQLIFTTFDIGQDENGVLVNDDKEVGMTAFNYNWAKHLEDRAGVNNYLLVALTEAACVPSRELGIPCYVNTFDYLKGVDVPRGTQVVLKWYYLLKMTELGYNAIFLDNDVATVKDPFLDWNMAYDFQGLSDAITEDGTVPKLLMDSTCGVGYFPWPPCISTGIMFVRSSEATIDLLKAMVVKLEEKGWEQAEFQGVVQPFMVNIENNPPALRLRVLPLENYHNLGMFDSRKAHKKFVSTIMAHCGYIHGGEAKHHELDIRGFWIPRPDL